MRINDITPTLEFSESTVKEQYEALYRLSRGSVFKIVSDYETVMRRIEEYTPANLVFKVFPINPGTALYTMYGPDHCIITVKQLKD